MTSFHRLRFGVIAYSFLFGTAWAEDRPIDEWHEGSETRA